MIGMIHTYEQPPQKSKIQNDRNKTRTKVKQGGHTSKQRQNRYQNRQISNRSIGISSDKSFCKWRQKVQNRLQPLPLPQPQQ